MAAKAETEFEAFNEALLSAVDSISAAEAYPTLEPLDKSKLEVARALVGEVGDKHEEAHHASR